MAGRKKSCHFRREIAHVTNFLTRQSDRAQLLIARRQHRIGAGRVVRIERVEPRQNRRRGFSRQLLKDDRSDERLEMGPFAARFESARADDFDYSREDRVDALEVADGGAEVSHAENLRLCDVPRLSAVDVFSRTRATLRMSAMNIRSASARWSGGARRTADGCTVATTAGAHSDSTGTPRFFMTLKSRPSKAFAAVAPRQTMTRGRTSAISCSSHGWQARISPAFGVL